MLPGVLTAPIRHGPSPSVNRPSRCDKVRQGATVSRQFGDTVASYELRIARSSMEESLEESSAFVPFVSFVCFVHMRLTCGFSFVCFVSFVRICLKTEFQVQLIKSILALFPQVKRFFETNLAIFWKNPGRIVLQSCNGLFQRAVVHGCVYVHRHAERRVPR